MAVGVTDRLSEVADIVSLVDEYRAQRVAEGEGEHKESYRTVYAGPLDKEIAAADLKRKNLKCNTVCRTWIIMSGIGSRPLPRACFMVF